MIDFIDKLKSGQLLKTPPVSVTQNGRIRKVGVEIEFAGLDPKEAKDSLCSWLKVEAETSDSPFVFRIHSPEWGDFKVELDTRFVSDGIDLETALKNSNIHLGKTSLEISRGLSNGVRNVIGALSTGIVPTEIVSPPIPWNELDKLSTLVARLRKHGAKGTDENPLYGFGLHLNPELYSDSPEDLLSLLRAYVLMSGWLREQIQVDATRELLPHVDPFPEDYITLILDADYKPSLIRLIEDYLRLNPTRNRELDMLPAFSYLAPEVVKSHISDDRIKARPTFHYRLPNVMFSDPEWDVSVEWNRWVAVEDLAADKESLYTLASRYHSERDNERGPGFVQEIATWLTA